ncbi:MAG: hypothetical protein ACMUIL_05900 [bacterium]
MDIKRRKMIHGFEKTHEGICVFEGSKWSQWRLGPDQLPAAADFIKIDSSGYQWKGTRLGLKLRYQHLLAQSWLILGIGVDRLFEWSCINMGDLLPDDSTSNEVLVRTAEIMEELFFNRLLKQLGADSFHIDLFSHVPNIQNLRFEIQCKCGAGDGGSDPFEGGFETGLGMQDHVTHIAEFAENRDQDNVILCSRRALAEEEMYHLDDISLENGSNHFFVESEYQTGSSIIKKITISKKVFGSYFLSFSSGGESLYLLWNHRPNVESGMLLLVKY